MRLSQLAALTGGELRGADREFATVGIDSRTLAPRDLFFALTGPRFDGHAYIADAFDRGACGAVVERWVDGDLPQIRVADTRLALGQLGKSWRLSRRARVVGLTGSNGKTTVKEMIAAILGVGASVLSTRGNLNNDLGVPLTLLGLRPEHRYAVIEMGANHPGEIAYVAGLAQPEIAVITNAGSAHLEGFGSREGVARAKGEIVAALGTEGIAVLNADDPFFSLWREIAGRRRVQSFGFGAGADVRGLAETIGQACGEDGFETRFEYEQAGRCQSIRLGLAGRHNVANALAAIAVADALGIGPEQIAEGLSRVKPVPGRLQLLHTGHGASIVNDTYNANPSSFAAALDVLLDLPGEPWIALGAFGELGADSAGLHAELGREAKRRGVARLYATGSLAEKAVETFGEGAEYFADQDDLIGHLEQAVRPGVVVLVKGSRSQRMERVVQALSVGRESKTCC
ncbi:UDP-N-acetylmuramoyl-tripeptide--D-alanyl-D-alanine ligase [Methylococcus sp. EFPC2]|uniref:UDP-N-acetylmuramoyl-tripeptide--D-alanyl-D- alanine ligase n=1 Tax=Methylococcus sp. EFPC2 TaxID=2812648 RepID=UPI0019689E04|nr:UDP-N-acetylmuramoyl-tripeptide--D-alanyl-D-alanine ligase [Methylococcus sp. EFPC2]QSA95930.1 UDP-N-acetylmuramoyl-tripeptide--D-alanyl-D-alanine ligase [Methylococcus sp. EFPC2]